MREKIGEDPNPLILDRENKQRINKFDLKIKNNLDQKPHKPKPKNQNTVCYAMLSNPFAP
jgi:hypothetical protein